jgi:RNA polymerase primary sigma factor
LKSTSYSLFDHVGDTKLLTREEEIELSKRIEKGDNAARERMIQANLRLALSVVKKYTNRGVDIDDLFQESVLGLTRAVDEFDWSKGFKFSTYAYWWIQAAVRAYIAANSGTIDLPSNAFSKLYKISEFENVFESQVGRKPTDLEIAEKFGTTPDTLRSLRQSASRTVALDKPMFPSEGGNRTLADVIPAREPSPDERIDRERLSAKINEVLSSLSEREKLIVKMRFGIED